MICDIDIEVINPENKHNIYATHTNIDDVMLHHLFKTLNPPRILKKGPQQKNLEEGVQRRNTCFESLSMFSFRDVHLNTVHVMQIS